MATDLVQLGERFAVKSRFLQADGVTTAEVQNVTFVARRGDGTLLPAPPVPTQIIEAGVTKWKVDLTPDRPGIWQFEFRAANPPAVATGAFVVEPSAT